MGCHEKTTHQSRQIRTYRGIVEENQRLSKDVRFRFFDKVSSIVRLSMIAEFLGDIKKLLFVAAMLRRVNSH